MARRIIGLGGSAELSVKIHWKQFLFAARTRREAFAQRGERAPGLPSNGQRAIARPAGHPWKT